MSDSCCTLQGYNIPAEVYTCTDIWIIRDNYVANGKSPWKYRGTLFWQRQRDIRTHVIFNTSRKNSNQYTGSAIHSKLVICMLSAMILFTFHIKTIPKMSSWNDLKLVVWLYHNLLSHPWFDFGTEVHIATIQRWHRYYPKFPELFHQVAALYSLTKWPH